MRRFYFLLLLSSLIFHARPASAQQVTDPTAVEFTASADHGALVIRYDLLLFVEGTANPVRLVELGKPSPNSNGTIRIPLRDVLDPLPRGDGRYEVRIAAVGTAGSTWSDPSNSFSFSTTTAANPTCEYDVRLDERSVAFDGGSGSFSVSATPGCGWASSTSVEWITITSGAAGVGNGTVSFRVDRNPGSGRRNGTITIAGQSTLMSQDGSDCSIMVSPTSKTVGRAGATVAISVEAPDGCDWSASAHSPWIRITGGETGSGSGTVTFAVEANRSSELRSTPVTVAGQTVVVVQPPAAPPSAPSGMRIVGR